MNICKRPFAAHWMPVSAKSNFLDLQKPGTPPEQTIYEATSSVGIQGYIAAIDFVGALNAARKEKNDR